MIIPRVAVATSGIEKDHGGGPSTRIPLLVEGLRKSGVDAYLPELNSHTPDLLHWLNVWPPDAAWDKLSRAKNAGVPIVFSPIFLDLSGRSIWNVEVPALANSPAGGLDVERLLELSHQTQSRHKDVDGSFRLYLNQVKHIGDRADYLIFLSEKERDAFSRAGVSPGIPQSIIRNATNIIDSSKAPEGFAHEHLQLDNFVVQVGRIETRKNQLVLAEACRRLEVPVVFIGSMTSPEYFRQVKEAAGPYGIFLPRMSHNDPLFISALRDANAFCLPSWAEGAPLAALEAGALGTPLILSDRSGESEYFGNFATYVNPGDLLQLMNHIADSIEKPDGLEAKSERASFVRDAFTWDKHINETRGVYEKVLAMQSSTSQSSYSTEDPRGRRLFFDVTDWVMSETPAGAARFQQLLFPLVEKIWPDEVIPVSWIRGSDFFGIVSQHNLNRSGGLEDIRKALQSSPGLRGVDIAAGDIFFSGSDAWAGNAGHLSAMKELRRAQDLVSVVLIHDLHRLTDSHLYPTKLVNDFEKGLNEIASFSDGLFVISEETKNNLLEKLTGDALFGPQVREIRLGDLPFAPTTSTRLEMTFHNGSSGDPGLVNSLPVQSNSDRSFILYVSTIEPRKNHVMLLEAYKASVEILGDRAPHLFLVERKHLAATDVTRWLASNPNVSPYVTHMTDADDQELSWLYSNCLFTLYPSVAEGWNLPIAESFSFGKVCVYSTTSSMPEVGKGFGVSLDPAQVEQWTREIVKLSNNRELLRELETEIRNHWKPFTWEASAENLIEQLLAVKTRPQAFAEENLHGVFSPADVSHRNIFLGFLGTGFHHLEEIGVWQSENSSTVKVPTTLVNSSTGSTTLHLKLSALTGSRFGKRLVTIRQGRDTETTIKVGAKPKVYGIKIDTSPSRPAVDWNVTINCAFLCSPKFLGIGEDVRQLGVLVHEIGFISSP